MDELAFLNERLMPFAKLMGVEYVSAEKDCVVAKLHVRDELCTTPTAIHGGALMAFADTLGAAGTILNLPEGARTTTLESKTNFLAAGRAGTTLVGEATPLHRGRTTMIWQTKIMSEADRLVAIVTQTQMVLPASN
jgi:1,4-dihydroxy-2-naphthoyl-CoA hydrolase